MVIDLIMYKIFHYIIVTVTVKPLLHLSLFHFSQCAVVKHVPQIVDVPLLNRADISSHTFVFHVEHITQLSQNDATGEHTCQERDNVELHKECCVTASVEAQVQFSAASVV